MKMLRAKANNNILAIRVRVRAFWILHQYLHLGVG